MEENTKLEASLGVSFQNAGLLAVALTHRSYLNEHRGSEIKEHNERMEFLGDAVLELVITDFLYKKYPEEQEGKLTSYRSALVNTVSLSQTARALGVNDYLLLSKGESQDLGRARDTILANTFEAIIGAIYLDQGYGAAEKFILEKLTGKVTDIVENRLWQDAKSRFQELAQEKEGITPHYEVVSEDGPDHDRVFTIGVFLKDLQIAEGKGRSKQDAEQLAAQAAIDIKGW
jgi:ribonuclease-3